MVKTYKYSNGIRISVEENKYKAYIGGTELGNWSSYDIALDIAKHCLSDLNFRKIVTAMVSCNKSIRQCLKEVKELKSRSWTESQREERTGKCCRTMRSCLERKQAEVTNLISEQSKIMDAFYAA